MISDSQAFSYSDQNVSVAALIRRRWAALIVQGSLTLVARKTIRLLMAALVLILTASHSHAGLGWTLAQFEQQYGKPVLDKEQIAGRIGYVFTGEDYIIAAFFRNKQVSRILYICRGGSVFDWERARALLRANAPDAVWDDASKNEADDTYRVNGTKDGLESYYASLADDGKMLAIWTQEDDEAGRTQARVDTPSVSSVVGSNEKEVTAGNVEQAMTVTPTCRQTRLHRLRCGGKLQSTHSGQRSPRLNFGHPCPAMRFFTSQLLMPKRDQPRSRMDISRATLRPLLLPHC